MALVPPLFWQLQNQVPIFDAMLHYDSVHLPEPILSPPFSRKQAANGKVTEKLWLGSDDVTQRWLSVGYGAKRRASPTLRFSFFSERIIERNKVATTTVA
jgi:hypothetical protein